MYPLTPIVLMCKATPSNTFPFLQSIQLARAHFAYCLGNPSECLSILSQIQLSAGQMEALPSSSTQVFSTTSHSDSDKARQRTGSVSTSTGRSSVADSLGTLKSQVNKMRPELVWWTLERVRGRCEEGLAKPRAIFFMY